MRCLDSGNAKVSAGHIDLLHQKRAGRKPQFVHGFVKISFADYGQESSQLNQVIVIMKKNGFFQRKGFGGHIPMIKLDAFFTGNLVFSAGRKTHKHFHAFLFKIG